MNNAKSTSRRLNTHTILLATVIVAGAAMMVIGLSPTPRATAQSQAMPPTPATGYLPSISDLMISTIQPRHVRIWQSAQRGNWKFAGYELGNLQGAFERLGDAHPTEHDISFPEMITSVTEPPFKDLKAAIAAKDQNAFSRAYVDLTSACNSCHQALNHGTVEIRVPSQTSASDLEAISAK